MQRDSGLTSYCPSIQLPDGATFSVFIVGCRRPGPPVPGRAVHGRHVHPVRQRVPGGGVAVPRCPPGRWGRAMGASWGHALFAICLLFGMNDMLIQLVHDPFQPEICLKPCWHSAHCCVGQDHASASANASSHSPPPHPVGCQGFGAGGWI